MSAATSVTVLIRYEDGTAVTATILPRDDEGPLLVELEDIEKVGEIVVGEQKREALGSKYAVRRRLDIVGAGTMRLFYGPPLDPAEPDEEVPVR